MVNNKPKYTLFKNASYALDGFIHALKHETSFKLELLIACFVLPAIYFMPFELVYKLVLLMTYFMIMIAELLNSAVENVVDLVTKEIHPLAKSAKDIGATAVLFTVILHILCWLIIGVHTFF
ncbi:MAG: Diacylglycerol kinase (EC [uncultured Sulfurovum sp.]|uniref:Diacylglycerol kinase n=1 Tax=uncultured Sulfurovum sp. TaxID=269237 RepID=A0A6S6T0S2_9BACT|nr:MAG: Diacylglycerol kinase (EC [uncultured Sulfurovum sp.]